jgi:hypothetical protein
MEPKIRFRMADLEPYYPEVNGVHQVLPWQRRFHYGITPSRKGADYTMISGGLGCGATTAICADIAFHLDRFPGIKLAVMANHGYVLDEFFEPVLTRILPMKPGEVLGSGNGSTVLSRSNDSTLRMMACDGPDNVRGFQCHRAYMIDAADWTKTETYQAEEDEVERYEPPDEAGFEAPIYTGNKITVTRTREIGVGKEMFKALCERCRAAGDFPRGVVVQQTPRGHNWAWEVFIKPVGDDAFVHSESFNEWEHTQMLGKTFYTLGISTYANTFLPPRFMESIQKNWTADPAMKQRLIDGEFGVK